MPVENKKLYDAVLSSVNGGAYCGNVFPYIIRRGDCYSVLAQRYNTDARTIMEINGITNPDYCPEGLQIMIPLVE